MKILKMPGGMYSYVLRQDGVLECLIDGQVENNFRVEFLETGHIGDLLPDELLRYDSLSNGPTAAMYVSENDHKELEYTGKQVTNEKLSKMKMSKMFGNVKMGKLSSDRFAVAMNMGIAIKAKNGSLYTYDTENNQLVDQMEFAFPMKDAFFGLPVAYDAVKAGDVIIDQKDRALFVKEISRSTGKIKAINVETGGETNLIKTSNVIMGTQFVTKVNSMMSMMGAQPGQSPEEAAAGNPFGQINPMMFMMMNDDEGDESSLLPLIMMANSGAQGQNGQQRGMNPMMMMMMMKDEKGSEKGGSSKMMEFMLMSQMMGGQNNGQQGIDPMMMMAMMGDDKDGGSDKMMEMMMMSQAFQGGNGGTATFPFGQSFGQSTNNVVEEPTNTDPETDSEA